VLGNVAWEDVVILVRDGGVQRVLALLRVAQQTAGQQQRDVILHLEDASTT
jgi:hypothetical protein